MANKTDKSYLLRCSSEIRNIIYRYVLTFDNPIVRGKPDEANRTLLALLQVCKSVEREAAPIFYEQNLFQFNLRHLDTPDVYKLGRAEQGLSPYDDAQMICPIIDVPQRHINSLRNLSLTKDVGGKHWPNGSLDDNSKLGPSGLGILDFESVINFLATRNNILKSLSIMMRRLYKCGGIRWDPDPSNLLRELDYEKRISTAVEKLANLDRLEIWKSRVTSHWPRPLKVPSEWTAVQPEALNQVKVDHFAKAKAILYTRRAGLFESKLERFSRPFFISEQFLIDFQQSGIEGRKLEYPSGLEREGGYDGRSTVRDYIVNV